MLRTILKSDLDELLRIENAVHVSPWTADTFKMCFQSGYLGWVVEVDKKVLGFIVVSLNSDECHVLNLCVEHAAQRKGWGKKLLEQALTHAKKEHVSIAYLEVRRSNSRAIDLYKKMQFFQVGERKNYYLTVSGNEDALVFAKSLLVDQ